MDKDSAIKTLEKAVSQSVMYKLQRHMPISISELPFSSHTYTALKNTHHTSLTEIMGMTDRDFFRIKQLGKSGMDEINALKRKIRDAGFFTLPEPDSTSSEETAPTYAQTSEKTGCEKFYAYFLPGFVSSRIPDDYEETVNTVLSSLKDKTMQAVVTMRFGLGVSGSQCSQKEIADKLHIDPKRVSQLLTGAKRVFSHPARNERLVYGNKKYSQREKSRKEKHKAELKLILDSRRLRKDRTRRIITDRMKGEKIPENSMIKVRNLLAHIMEPESIEVLDDEKYREVQRVAGLLGVKVVDTLFQLTLDNFLSVDDFTAQTFSLINEVCTARANAAAQENAVLNTVPDDTLDIVPLYLICLPEYERVLLEQHGIDTFEKIMRLTNAEFANIPGIGENEASAITRTCARFLHENAWANAGNFVLNVNGVVPIRIDRALTKNEANEGEINNKERECEEKVPVQEASAKKKKSHVYTAPSWNRWNALSDYADMKIESEVGCSRLYKKLMTKAGIHSLRIPANLPAIFEKVMHEKLLDNERVVLCLRYGLYKEGIRLPVMDVAELFNVTPSRISHVDTKALTKLLEEDSFSIIQHGLPDALNEPDKKYTKGTPTTTGSDAAEWKMVQRIARDYSDALSIDGLETRISNLLHSDIPVSNIPFTQRTSTALSRAKIKKLSDLLALGNDELMRIPNLSQKGMSEIRSILTMQILMAPDEVVT